MTIAQLQEKTNCSFVVDKKNSTVAVLGLAEEVEGAAAEVRALFQERKRVEVTLKYSPEQKGTLLGKSGSTINRISTESGAQLDLSRDECTIRIHGPAATVERAKDMIEELLFLKAASVQMLEIPADCVDNVFGKGGENVRRLQTAHKTSIDNLRPPGDKREAGRDEREPTKVKIRGSVEGVKCTVREISEIIDREKKIEEVVQVQSQHVGMLLGKGGATINAIQKECGAVLDMQKKADEGSSMQAVTIRGNTLQVKKAQAALEGVLKYKAESHDVLVVDAAMMPLLIGKDGVEINRIRTTTGAAIDAERDPEKPQFKLRGTKQAVEAARAALEAAVESNKRVGEHVPLPWHCIDVLVGPNADALRKFEADLQVQVELPGQNLASEVVGSGSFLPTITSSLQLKGRKKHVDAAVARLQQLEAQHALEELQLDDDDALLLSRLWLEDDALVGELEREHGVAIGFQPVEGLLSIRGEDAAYAARALRNLLARERPTELLLPCEATPLGLLKPADGAVLQALRARCAPVEVAVVEAALRLFAAGRLLPTAQEAAEAWMQEHREHSETCVCPPETHAVVLRELPALQRAHGVGMALEQMSLIIKGPAAYVEAAHAAAVQLVKQHKHFELTLDQPDDDLAVVELYARKHPCADPKVEVRRGAGGYARLRGSEAGVERYKATLDAEIAEAARCAVRLPVNRAQLAKLSERARAPQGGRGGEGSGGGGGTLLQRLQEQHGCALVPAPATLELQLRGRAEAVAKLQQALEAQLDVDEHERTVATHLVPVIIGKQGANIRQLQQDSGATVSLDRGSGRVAISGRKAAVRAAVAALDELMAANSSRDLPIKERQIALIIGRGGATIKQLQADSGATINVQKEECCLKVRGSQQAVDLAVQLINAKLSAPTQNASRPPPGLGAPPPAQQQPPTTTAPPPGLVK